MVKQQDPHIWLKLLELSGIWGLCSGQTGDDLLA